jgi:LmbE family N-acetylglucosaminyl deacetylase
VSTPQEWARALAEHRPGEFDAGAHRRVVVVAAHPDDETIGAGGALRALDRAGAEVVLVVATDGEAAHPGLGADDRRALAAVRRAETDAALAELGLGHVPVHRLGLPDSALAEHAPALRDALREHLAGADAYLAPWPHDPHPDHAAVARAAAEAAPVTAHGWSYLIWTWAWSGPDDRDLSWPRARVVTLTDDDRAARDRAVRAYASQLAPGPDGSPAVLAAGLLEHLNRPVDLLLREPRATAAPAARFAELYEGGQDPWAGDSWYERRKRRVVLASLPRERYRSAVEPGCGTGDLTLELAARCDHLLATDYVADAADRARAAVRTAGADGVEVRAAALPDSLPDGPIDLAVFSEVLYYLGDAALDATVERALAALEPGGDVVVVHWRGWPAEAPRDAAATHRVLVEHPDLDVLVEHVDERFLLHVLRRR